MDFVQQFNAKGTIGPQFVRECAFVVLIGPPSAHYEPETHKGYVGPNLAGGDGLEHGSIPVPLALRDRGEVLRDL